MNGFSTSLSQETQINALRKVPGFENCKLFRPGYAIEYDFFPPTQLTATLETKKIQNLFFAGQINGTTGYEEAACQGLMAGINAHAKVTDKEPFILKRSEAYIGVLIDDLINKGTDEPYRMFTSRAEYRTLLRQDNADIRLTEMGYNLGLASKERLDIMNKKKDNVQQIVITLETVGLSPEEANDFLEAEDQTILQQKQKAAQLLTRPGMELKKMVEGIDTLAALRDYSDEELEQASIQIKYEVYIRKESELVDKMKNLEELSIPAAFDYNKLSSLSNEARQKFTTIQPRTLGQASRISGVNPSDVQILMVYMGR